MSGVAESGPRFPRQVGGIWRAGAGSGSVRASAIVSPVGIWRFGPGSGANRRVVEVAEVAPKTRPRPSQPMGPRAADLLKEDCVRCMGDLERKQKWTMHKQGSVQCALPSKPISTPPPPPPPPTQAPNSHNARTVHVLAPRQTCGGAQTRATSTVCGSGFLSDQAPVCLARKYGSRQLPPRPVLLAGQPRGSANVPRPPRKARGETEERVAVCRTGSRTPEVGSAHDRGHQGGI